MFLVHVNIDPQPIFDMGSHILNRIRNLRDNNEVILSKKPGEEFT